MINLESARDADAMFNPILSPLCLMYPEYLSGTSFWARHIPFAFALAEALRPRVFVELGTHKGDSYLAFCQAFKQLNTNTQCYAVDTWSGDAHVGEYGPEILRTLRLQHDKKYESFSTLLQADFLTARAQFKSQTIDLLHIDGLHTYEAVKNDFETWLPALSDQAIVIFHDIRVYKLDFGVWKLWNELQGRYDHFELRHACGLGVLFVGQNQPTAMRSLLHAAQNEMGFDQLFDTLGRHIERSYQSISKENEQHRRCTQQALVEIEITDLEKRIGELRERDFNQQPSGNKIHLALEDKLSRLKVNQNNEVTPSSIGQGDVPAEMVCKAKPKRWYQRPLNAYKSVTRTIKSKSYSAGRAIDRFRKQVGTRILADNKHSKRLQSEGIPTIEKEPPEPRSIIDPKVKLIAYYLPQFHPVPENDLWWGKGFTEWTNVTKAKPLYPGHYQPHLPADLGYYDLRLPEVMQQQIEMAQQFGIHGFCFYYYWFGSRRLLEKPVDMFLEHREWRFPFCLCWANENWTKRWDGQDQELLIGQTHSPADDLQCIRDLSRYLADERYIRVDNKPVIIVYRAKLLPDSVATAERWRNYCRQAGFGDIMLVAAQTYGITDPRPFGFDGAVEFPPHGISPGKITAKVEGLPAEFRGEVYDYPDIMVKHPPIAVSYPLFRSVFTAWDNTARRKLLANIFENATPRAYEEWLEQVVAFTSREVSAEHRFVFINAWNEWAEGAHLEPDGRWGYAHLNATGRVQAKYSTGAQSVSLFGEVNGQRKVA